MNRIKLLLTSLFIISISARLIAQEEINNATRDSIYISEVEDVVGRDKVLHAEPLFIDLIRDLGARKGEKEWNVGFGMTDKANYNAYETLIEYEWAPIDRLGLEVELPFSFYSPLDKSSADTLPLNRLESLKLATQWSFFVNERISTSLAIGYIHEFITPDFSRMGKQFLDGNLYNPFFVAAKRWGNNFHTLLYTGPLIEKELHKDHVHFSYDINTNFHYMITGTRNFIGLEINKTLQHDEFTLTLRPQMRVEINDHLLIGIVTGIPIGNEKERISTFLRIIYEPKHKIN
jgi:hypothetical protein